MTAVAHALAHHGITVTLGKSSQFQGDLDRWKPQLGVRDATISGYYCSSTEANLPDNDTMHLSNYDLSD